MKDLGHLRYFLRIMVVYSSSEYLLSQKKYISDMLQHATLANASFATSPPVTTPMELHLKLRQSDGDPLPNPTRYRELVGALIYFSATRPDISYVVHTLSQFMAMPTTVHYDTMLRLLLYLQGTITRSLLFPSESSLMLRAYTDAGWVDDLDTRRSTTGYCIFLGSSLLSWRSKRQHRVSRSSTKAEYCVIADTTLEIHWLRHLLHDLGVSIPSLVPLYCDNTSAIQNASNPVPMAGVHGLHKA
ncbi:uncharacterized protein LOC109823413 [Asparagus officinalis]|uniref:uncharacterized protein LOC109823413 n=1 Tax=Asparagus officinalis TaxID=4686 RepID=UPI00098E2371|nr:uncharacterized protein LOC109823413 [Asparagus officinalis]